MTVYATQADLVQRFGEAELISLTDRDGTAGAIVASVIDQVLADASAEIDGYIGGRYKLPLATVPAVLNRLCCDIARFLLYDVRADDQLVKRYEAVIKFLTALGKGDLSLGLPDEGEAGPSQNLAEIQSDGHVFRRGNSKGFI
uniref:gp436 family protein n=1 Tax=Marinobacterium profundum TaxID=1714300 RepID=UPI00083128CB|nr:phage protein Gp36 family protein [Marinobacterium profundum]